MAIEKETENSVDKTEPLKPTSGRAADEVIDAVGRMSIDDLQKPDAGLKLLIAQYKEKCDEGRSKQDKINALSIKSSDLSNKLGVARERLKNVSGVGVAFQFINIIAGAILAFLAPLPTSNAKTILYILAIGLFLVCALYYLFTKDDNKKDIEESGSRKTGGRSCADGRRIQDGGGSCFSPGAQTQTSEPRENYGSERTAATFSEDASSSPDANQSATPAYYVSA